MTPEDAHGLQEAIMDFQEVRTAMETHLAVLKGIEARLASLLSRPVSRTVQDVRGDVYLRED